MAAALSVRTTTTTSLVAAVLPLCVVVSLSLRGADAARGTPGDSPIVATCLTGPYPELCVGELGQRLLDVQTVIASAAPNQGAAKIAGAPGQVDVKALVSVALEAATEAGTILVSIFEGKLPGFNTGVPDFKKCLGNCTVTMKSAMQKLHGAKAALHAGDKQVAKTLALRSVADVSSCTISCRELNGDVRLIVTQSLTEFTKMLQIAIGFISKMKSGPSEPKPPSEPQPPPTWTTP
jgi:pectinesterase inhibitor-like protein